MAAVTTHNRPLVHGVCVCVCGCGWVTCAPDLHASLQHYVEGVSLLPLGEDHIATLQDHKSRITSAEESNVYKGQKKRKKWKTIL